MTYLGDGQDLIEEEERENLLDFLTPVWTVYNPEVFSEKELQEARASLDKYMEDQVDRNVYILAI